MRLLALCYGFVVGASELELERLGLVPTHVREYVLERDAQCCRVCGTYLENPALHHIVFRSQGGLDVPSNLLTIGWTPYDCSCHSKVAHGVQSRVWREVFLAIADRPGVTALQAMRWARTAGCSEDRESLESGRPAAT